MKHKRTFRKQVRDFDGFILHARKRGLSYRGIQQQLKIRNLTVHHSTIYRYLHSRQKRENP